MRVLVLRTKNRKQPDHLFSFGFASFFWLERRSFSRSLPLLSFSVYFFSARCSFLLLRSSPAASRCLALRSASLLLRSFRSFLPSSRLSSLLALGRVCVLCAVASASLLDRSLLLDEEAEVFGVVDFSVRDFCRAASGPSSSCSSRVLVSWLAFGVFSEACPVADEIPSTEGSMTA